MRAALLDRLELNDARVKAMADGIRQVAALPDPIGQVVRGSTLPNGLQVTQKRVPLGVVGIIVEARPNVTADAAALCLKSGNAALLRGGKEARNSNLCLGQVMGRALLDTGLPEGALQVVEDPSRDSANAMMELTDYLDVLIPRGGAGLIRAVSSHSRVPVIRTGEGVCHVYVHADADLDMAGRILYNAKCSRPSTCNAAECLLVDRAVAGRFLPMAWELLNKKNVQLHGCPETQRILGPVVIPAQSEDWDAEYNDFQLAVKVVSGPEEAAGFIARHGSGHSEAIVTESYTVARWFLDTVDAAAVYVNASTRFTDGFEFGLGAEIGISTQKLHARGPMGLEALTSTKYAVFGSGQLRE